MIRTGDLDKFDMAALLVHLLPRPELEKLLVSRLPEQTLVKLLNAHELTAVDRGALPLLRSYLDDPDGLQEPVALRLRRDDARLQKEREGRLRLAQMAQALALDDGLE